MKPVYAMLVQKFSYKADEVRSFILSVDTFILTLNNGRIVHYCPSNIAAFWRWLLDNNIQDSKTHLRFTELFR